MWDSRFCPPQASRQEPPQSWTLSEASPVPDCGRRLLVQPSSLMLFSTLYAITVLAAANQPDFSQSYGVWVSADKGRCAYWLTDVGLNSRQLTDVLKQSGYEVRRGAEILTDADTPVRCVREAARAARQAGFVNVRARLGTEKDRMHGIP